MERYERCTIKSFKHNGRIHRQWQTCWIVPQNELEPAHRAESFIVLINRQTPIVEADGKQWISKVPAVSFFIPGMWFNAVALLEADGIRYYCNIASPPYLYANVLTYIDYDLDVIRPVTGGYYVVDEEEYERHKQLYHYPTRVQQKVQAGLRGLIARIEDRKPPFDETAIMGYYDLWHRRAGEAGI